MKFKRADERGEDNLELEDGYAKKKSEGQYQSGNVEYMETQFSRTALEAGKRSLKQKVDC